MRAKFLSILLGFFIAFWAFHLSESDNNCDNDSFCQYQCHCDNQCFDDSGLCPEGVKCDPGWFGLRCQYKNLLLTTGTTVSVNPEQTTSWLTDKDDNTCNRDPQLKSLTLNWYSTYITTTTIHIYLNDTAMYSTVKITYNTTNGENECNVSFNKFNQWTIDCNYGAYIQNVKIQGNITSICSVKIDEASETNYSISMDPAPTAWLTDEVDMTCNSDPNLKSITVAWDIKYPLTWIRMVLYDNEMFSTIRIIYFTANGDRECKTLSWVFLNHKTVDIRCEDHVQTNNITLMGNIVSLCSLYISGGRNVAFKQNAMMSEYLNKVSADSAVDGNIVDINNNCLHFQQYLTAFYLTLNSNYAVSRFVFYTSVFQGTFIMTTYDDIDNAVDFFAVDSTKWQNEITLYGNAFHSIRFLTFVYMDLEDSSPNLNMTTLCEIILYGECPPGKWSLSCTKDCPSSCTTSCHRDDGACTMEMSVLFSESYHACDKDSFCQYQCHCDNQCFNDSGLCPQGDKCDPGWFGLRCQYRDLLLTTDAKVSFNPKQTTSWLTDDDDNTCNRDLQLKSVTLNLDNTYITIATVQIYLKDSAMYSTVKITYNTTSNDNECDVSFNKLNQWTIDCNYGAYIQNVKIQGNITSICSAKINEASEKNYSISMDTTPTTWLIDNDDMTCNSDPNLKSITVAWDIDYPLTWIRMVLNDNEMFSTVRIIYFTANGDTECNNLSWAYLHQNTMDIRCEDYVKTKNITLIGNIVSLCSLYISGGRNVAYKQKAMMNVFLNKVSADLAVDGNIINLLYNCLVFLQESSTFYLTLNNAYIVNSFVLYKSVYPEPFIMRTYDGNISVIDTFVGGSENWQYGITMYGNASHSIKSLTIDYINSYDRIPRSFTTLCEIILYGECPPGKWSLPCTKDCNSSCPTSCHRDNGECNKACAGYRDPPECTKFCIIGSWGINCANNCSDTCGHLLCDSITGQCQNEHANNNTKDVTDEKTIIISVSLSVVVSVTICLIILKMKGKKSYDINVIQKRTSAPEEYLDVDHYDYLAQFKKNTADETGKNNTLFLNNKAVFMTSVSRDYLDVYHHDYNARLQKTKCKDIGESGNLSVNYKTVNTTSVSVEYTELEDHYDYLMNSEKNSSEEALKDTNTNDEIERTNKDQNEACSASAESEANATTVYSVIEKKKQRRTSV